jgi:dimethylargininase
MQYMLKAITRSVSPAMNGCELAYLPRIEIDIPKAAEQHRRYEACLRELGVSVISLPAEPELPDAIFVEDPAVVVREVAVMTRMGAASRRKESESLAMALSQFRPIRWMQEGMREPATLEGGDVLRAGRTLFVGMSPRTNRAGIAQLAAELEPLGYAIRPVEVHGCLHLKSACTSLGDRTMLANRAWCDTAALDGFQILDVPADEPWAANVLTIGDTALVPACFPGTARIVERLGWKIRILDISELMKAEAALTCSSIVFE